MPNDLITADPIIAQNFFLEIDGDGRQRPRPACPAWTSRWTSSAIQQIGDNGQGSRSSRPSARPTRSPDLSLTRMAPPDVDGRQDVEVVQRHP